MNTDEPIGPAERERRRRTRAALEESRRPAVRPPSADPARIAGLLDRVVTLCVCDLRDGRWEASLGWDRSGPRVLGIFASEAEARVAVLRAAEEGSA
ncbi:MAG: hypothetical protein JO363_03280 [Solirubrobacterales bacterium]|nr:hypothetical protein [Solirubrobacterales bacterium]